NPNVADFSEALMACCDPTAAPERTRRAANARSKLDTHYSKEQFSTKLLNSYQKILNAESQPYGIVFSREAAAPKVLVTGAAGFVGGYIVAHLRQQGIAVRAMVRKEKDVA